MVPRKAFALTLCFFAVPGPPAVLAQAPPPVVLQKLGSGAQAIGLEREQVVARLEQHLDGLRMLERRPRDETYLYVLITVLGEVFSLNVELVRPPSGEAAWSQRALGVHDGNAERVLEALDRLLRAYQRAQSDTG